MHEIFQKLQELKADFSSSLRGSGSPYITCNEQNQQKTLQYLAGRTSSEQNKNSLHVGFSVWANLDTICTTRPYYAAIFDIDPSVHAYIYPLLRSMILTTDSVGAFCPQFLANLKENDDLEPLTSLIQEQLNALQRAGFGFLANESNFKYLKTMIADGRLFFGNADLSNAAHILLIREWIHENELILNTLYLSNIPDWLKQRGQEGDWENTKSHISSMLRPETLVIDAFYPTSKKDGSGPPQRVTLGGLPSYEIQRADNRAKRRKGFFQPAPSRIDSILSFEEAGADRMPPTV